MKKNKIDSQTSMILEKIKDFPKGISLGKLYDFFRNNISKRTLQRRLTSLLEKKLLLAEGGNRNRRYIFPINQNRENNFLRGNPDLLLSSDAEKIQEAVSKPIQSRKYVSYHKEFLENYKPNTTFYLTQSTRSYLAEIGKSPDGIRPAGTFAKQIFHRLLIDLSWNSSRLEGNTYLLLETEQLIEKNIFSEKRDEKETQMILNHKAAIEFLIESAQAIRINSFTIRNIHALLSKNLLGNLNACGQLRQIPVGIAQSVYIPLAIPQMIEECFIQLINTAFAIQDPFEQAFFLMVHLPYLQPFEDVNIRVSRMAANIPLIQKNLCPLSFVDVPDTTYINGLIGVYELNKIELLQEIFVWSYERSSSLYTATCKSLGYPDPFRLKHREDIAQTIQEVIKKKMDKNQTVIFLEEIAKTKLTENPNKFIEVIQTELLNLHEGNIACYQLKLEDFTQWKTFWH